MGFSPQQLERMLSLLDAQGRPAPQAPLGISPSYFEPEPGSAGTSYLSSQGVSQPPLVPVGAGAFAPQAVPQPTAEVHPPSPTTELPDRTASRAALQRDSVASRTDSEPPLAALAADPSAPPDDFSEFSGKAPKEAPLPRGAKNVQCHSIERDPDTGRILKVYSYTMESADGA